MITFIKLYIITLPILIAIDMFWLGLVAKNFYAKQIGFLMKADINWVAVILFYVLFAFGLVVFVIRPGIEKNSWLQAFLSGALLGLIAYAAYDFTNLATIKGWPILVTVVDLSWGVILAAIVSTVTYLIATNIG